MDLTDFANFCGHDLKVPIDGSQDAIWSHEPGEALAKVKPIRIEWISNFECYILTTRLR